MIKKSFIVVMILSSLLISSVVYAKARNVSVVADAGSVVTITCTNSTASVSESNGVVTVNCVSLLPTATLTSSPTSTPVPTDTPTNTPVNTFTPSPTSTTPPIMLPTATKNPVLALKDYPLCTSHDETKWHSTIDNALQCHYDHSHGDDPSLANDIFGDWTFNGQTVSYPHASSPAENMYEQYIGSTDKTKKHAGYFYLVRKNLPNSPVVLPNWNTPVDSWVRDIRVQVHFWGEGDTQVRFHSYYYEIRVQNKATGAYGIIKTGGLMDTGILQLYKLQWLPVAGQDPSLSELTRQWLPGYDENIHGSIDPYRGYKQACSQLVYKFDWDEFISPTYNMTIDNTGLSNDVLWSLAPNVYGYNKIAGVSVEKFDNPDCITAGPINKENPYSATYEIKNLCQLGNYPNCRFNGSEVGMFMTFVIVPSSWDNSSMDTNPATGIVSMRQWTNVKGDIVNGCTMASYDCIPLILENMPVGQAFFQRSGSGKVDLSEFDLTPPDHIVNGRWESWHRQ